MRHTARRGLRMTNGTTFLLLFPVLIISEIATTQASVNLPLSRQLWLAPWGKMLHLVILSAWFYTLMVWRDYRHATSQRNSMTLHKQTALRRSVRFSLVFTTGFVLLAIVTAGLTA